MRFTACSARKSLGISSTDDAAERDVDGKARRMRVVRGDVVRAHAEAEERFVPVPERRAIARKRDAAQTNATMPNVRRWRGVSGEGAGRSIAEAGEGCHNRLSYR